MKINKSFNNKTKHDIRLFKTSGIKAVGEGFLCVGEKVEGAKYMKTINIINGKYRKPFRIAI